jgi:hypothetical protein
MEPPRRPWPWLDSGSRLDECDEDMRRRGRARRPGLEALDDETRLFIVGCGWLGTNGSSESA